MKTSAFDKTAGAVIILSIGFTLYAATSWDWFPTPGEWGDIAHIPNTTKNHIALLLFPIVTFLYLVIRRRYFGRKQ